MTMPRPFHQLTLEEFIDLLGRFPFEGPRTIDAVHMHHTWRPNHAQYRGEETIVSMWRFHTEQNGWSDIAQHVTIAPDGTIWTGRDWNRPPASAAGHNGSTMSHPFMFEMIGDFDRGKDRFADPQRQATLEVIAHVQHRFGLPVESLRFHREMSQKTCPGNGLSRDEILASVRKLREGLEEGARGGRRRGIETPRPFADSESATRARIDAALRSFGRAPATAAAREVKQDPHEAELLEAAMPYDKLELLLGPASTMQPWPAVDAGRGAGTRAAPALSPEMLADLRPHVINLDQGLLSGDGLFSTTPADVEAIFNDHLRRRVQAQPAGVKLPVLFFAHGGLVNEASGLFIAHQQVRWWNDNGVYPIFFVWETGLGDALRQILGGTRAVAPREAPRDLTDITDLGVERTARLLGGGKIWSAMKRSAERAVETDGGARFVAERLKAFCDAHGGAVELHAMGHSAGSIFHAHFLDAALALGVPPLRSLTLLAPAIRVTTFTQTMLPRIGSGIGKVVMFTMQRDFERADQVAGIYRKSLLYLVSRALEREREEPILGLEDSVRDDARMRALFGLEGAASPAGEVVWSVTREDAPPRSASTSRTHGGFDNDAATMNSAARRIVGRDDIVPFPDAAIERALAITADPLADLGGMQAAAANGGAVTAPVTITASGFAPLVGAVVPASLPAAPGGGGRRRALCIGIDRYATAPLAGCVADARTWARTLQSLGFEAPVTLFDEQATRTGILDALNQLLRGSTAGDVVVFQFAGHGTLLPDVDGDETIGPAAGFDQAICPADFASGAFLIDDDVAAVFRAIPDGVNLTCFIDCCHSGTVTRFAVGRPGGSGPGDRRARFLKADDAMKAAHRRFRAAIGRQRAATTGGPELMREVLFSACLPSEVAFEANGQGDFTRRATQILAAGLGTVTHEEFHRKVTEAFGPTPQQHPDLDCAPAARSRPLLAPLVAAAGAPARAIGVPGVNGGGASANALIAQSLRAIADLLQNRE
jgi:hypothetical protein